MANGSAVPVLAHLLHQSILPQDNVILCADEVGSTFLCSQKLRWWYLVFEQREFLQSWYRSILQIMVLLGHSCCEFHLSHAGFSPSSSSEMMAVWPELAPTSESGTNSETCRRIMELFLVTSNNLGIMYTLVGELSHGVYIWGLTTASQGFYNLDLILLLFFSFLHFV